MKSLSMKIQRGSLCLLQDSNREQFPRLLSELQWKVLSSTHRETLPFREHCWTGVANDFLIDIGSPPAAPTTVSPLSPNNKTETKQNTLPSANNHVSLVKSFQLQTLQIIIYFLFLPQINCGESSINNYTSVLSTRY